MSKQPSQVEVSESVPKTPWHVIVKRTLVALAVLWILRASAIGAELDFPQLVYSRRNMIEFASGFLQPNFMDWRSFGAQMLVTIHIAIWGTFLAIILAVPCSLLCADNISPWWVRQPVRRLMDTFRAINEMIFAMLFITAVGLGPFAGVLALFIHTLGTLTKLFSEAVEAIDSCPVEGIRATGATAVDEVVYGVIPQVMPLWISYTLYRFEANVRSASVVGMVGAGGIGMLLWDAIRGFDYARASAILIMIVVTVTLIDFSSSLIRKRFS